MNIIEALHDSRLFLPWFRDVTTWRSWETFLKALFALPIDNLEDRKLFQEATGLTEPPTSPAKESFVLAGRRSGKSSISSVLAVWVSCFKDWSKTLSPGETGWVFVIAVDKAQASIVKRYIRAILDSSPSFRKLVKGETQETISLSNNICISIKTSSFRSLRGYSVCCAILEELSFWRSEVSANPDREILAALRPALSTVPDSLLIGISTPYSRAGAMYDAYKNFYGKASGPLIWKAESTRMNPILDPAMIQREIEADPESAKAEWLAEFRSDISAFIGHELIEAVTIPGRYELPKLEGISYVGFCDPSGGRSDSFTLGIAHRNAEGRAVLDVLLERRPPFSPESTVSEYADILKAYGLHTVTGDRFGAEFTVELFRKQDIFYQASERTSSEIFLEFLPMIASSRIELLDSKRLRSQLAGLERKTRSGGRDQVGHYPGGHDDVVICAAGSLVLAGQAETRDGIPTFMPEQAATTMEELEERKERCWLLGRKFSPTPQEKELLEEAELEKKLLEEIEKGDGS